MFSHHSRRHLAPIAASLALLASFSAGAADHPTLPRQTGVGSVIAAQGNAALQHIRVDLAASLQRQFTLPALGVQATPSRDVQAVQALALRASLSP